MKAPKYGRGLAILVASVTALVVLVPLVFYLLLLFGCVMYRSCP